MQRCYTVFGTELHGQLWLAGLYRQQGRGRTSAGAKGRGEEAMLLPETQLATCGCLVPHLPAIGAC